MEQKVNLKIPRDSIIYLCVCLSGIAVFILFGIVPYYRASSALDGKIAGLASKIEEHEKLLPIYQSLKQTLEKNPLNLPSPPEPVSQEKDTQSILATLKEAGERANLKTVSLTPLMNSPAVDAKFLGIEMTIRGDLFAFRKFLVALGKLPYVERIEDVHLKQGSESMEFRIKVQVRRG